MKWSTLIGIGVLASASGVDAEIGPWATLSWGLSRERVRELRPDFEAWMSAPLPNIFDPNNKVPEKHYGEKSHYIGVCNFSSDLNFSDNNLSSIHMDQSDDNDLT